MAPNRKFQSLKLTQTTPVIFKNDALIGWGDEALQSGVDIQVEVESIDQLREALGAGATSVLLDNFTPEMMVEAVAVTAGKALLEVSGNVKIEQMADIAATGVDRISIGRLTKDVKATDYSMRVLERL